MHQPSTPTPEYGAPALPITSKPSARGRCATCSEPIHDDQDAVHVRPGRSTLRLPTHLLPYRHTGCDE